MRARMWLCLTIGVVVILASGAAGATARAADYGYSGTLAITSVLAPTSSGSVYVQGTYSVTHACTDTGDFTYCGYFLVVTTVAKGAPCRPDTLAWVQQGIYDHSQGQVPQSGQVSWSEYATAGTQTKTACLRAIPHRAIRRRPPAHPATPATRAPA
jgi:hypothetical protein